MPTQLLIKYDKIRNEPQNTTIPHGTFGHQRNNEWYTYIGFDDAEEELKRMEEFRKAQTEIEKKNDAKAVSQKMFKVV